MPRSKDMTLCKPLLVGELNPYGSDPHFALYPAPDGCSGHRLCCLILGMHRKDYLDVFERRNLCTGKWSMREAYKSAEQLRTWRAPIIMLGSKVARAFNFLPFEPFTEYGGGATAILSLPHTSGLCRTWNEPGAMLRAREMVAATCPDIAHLIGVAFE